MLISAGPHRCECLPLATRACYDGLAALKQRAQRTPPPPSALNVRYFLTIKDDGHERNPLLPRASLLSLYIRVWVFPLSSTNIITPWKLEGAGFISAAPPVHLAWQHLGNASLACAFALYQTVVSRVYHSVVIRPFSELGTSSTRQF